MNLEKYLNSLEQSAANVPVAAARWATFEDEFRDFLRDELRTLLHDRAGAVRLALAEDRGPETIERIAAASRLMAGHLALHGATLGVTPDEVLDVVAAVSADARFQSGKRPRVNCLAVAA